METRTKLSLSEAAKFLGCSKGTLSKARANGDLSAKKVGNTYEIEIAELERWNDSRSKRNVSKNVQGNRLEPPKNALGNSALEVEVEMLRERLAEKDAQIEKAEEREAHLLAAVRHSVCLRQRLSFGLDGGVHVGSVGQLEECLLDSSRC